MKTIGILAIYWFSQILIFALIFRAILSWFPINRNGAVGKLHILSIKLTEPIVLPCKKILSRFDTGMFDFSVLLAMFMIEVASSIVIRLIYRIF